MAKLTVGKWTIDEKRCCLIHDEREITVQYRVMALLIYLSKHKGEVLSKDELAKEVWQGVVVSDDAIVNAIVKLRKALGDTSKNPQYIETIPKVGYRFIASVLISGVPSPLNTFKRTTKSRGALISWSLLLMSLLALYIFSIRTSNEELIDKSLVVLPLLNLTGGQETEYFSNGLTEELINTLAQQTEMRVTARTSSFLFKGSDQPLNLIAEQLNVRYLIQGSVRRYQQSVRISLQVIDSNDYEQLLSISFDEEMNNLLVLQKNIADQVVKALSTELSVSLVNLPEHKNSVNNINANDLYWLGHHQLKQRTIEGINKSIDTFASLVEANYDSPKYHLALAEAYLIKSSYTSEDIQPLFAAAHSLLTKVGENWKDSNNTQEIWGLYFLTTGDFDKAIKTLTKVAKASKNNARVRMWLGTALQNKGEIHTARDWLEQGKRLDPLNPTLNRLLARNMLRGGQYQEGIELLLQSTEFNDESAQLELELARWAFNYKRADAMKWAKLASEKEPDQIESRVALAFAYLQRNDIKQANEYIHKAQLYSPNSPLVFNASVNFYLAAGQRNELVAYVDMHREQTSSASDVGSVGYQTLWRGISYYYQRNYTQALEHFNQVIGNNSFSPIEQVEALVFSSLAYLELEQLQKHNIATQQAVSLIQSLHNKGWDMPYLSACLYVIFQLQNDELNTAELLRRYPKLLVDFKSYIKMHDIER